MAQSSGGAKVSGYASFGFDRGIGAPRRLGSQYVDIVLEYGTGSKPMGVARLCCSAAMAEASLVSWHEPAVVLD